jgi:hypothetical protein
MAIADARLNLLTFPQRWDGTQIWLRVLALPKGDPRQPLFAGGPVFAQSTLRLRARVIPSLDKMPDPADALPAGPHFAETPPGIAAVFGKLAASFNINPALVGNPRPPDTVFKKYLTKSYQRAFAFDGPSHPFVVTNNAYECALKDPRLTNRPPRPPVTDELSWGKALAFAIRQPVLSAALGLLFEETIPLPDPQAFAAGGWLYVDLDPASDFAPEFAAQPELLGLFAARIPPLSTERSLFAAVSFPVIAGVTGAFDEQFAEAESYDDGFARIVHGSQPEHGGIVETERNASPIVKDIGIRLGWDDEQIAVWLNRQIAPAMITPMGVAGYRVDVRKPGTLAWHSLTRAQGDVLLGDLNLGQFDDEFAVEAVPLQLAAQKTGDYWLPSYFATWNGSSLILRTETALKLAKREHVLAERPFSVPNANEIPTLRYGEAYEFRVRLVDLSRGGPDVNARRVNPAPAPEVTIPFRRFAPPKGVLLERHPAQQADQPLSRFRVLRPFLGYPDALFAGVANSEALLLSDLPMAGPEERETGLPDPDVRQLEITVEVLLPETAEGRGGPAQFLPIYTTTREFDGDPGVAMDLGIVFQDHKNLAGLQAADPLKPIPGIGDLVVPSARQVRLRLTAVCKSDPGLDYFGSESARRSAFPVFVELRAPSKDEQGLFVPDAPGKQMQAIFLQPDLPGGPSNAAARLAQKLGLVNTGLTFTGHRGRRTVFGCAGALRHTLAPDRSAITFASASDLIRQWIIAIRVQLDRDWTWDALAQTSFEIERDSQVIGTIEMPRTISQLALSGDRTKTDLIFFHAIDPKPQPADFPAEIHTRYLLRARFRDEPATADLPLEWPLRLPVAVAPAQTPKLVSAGIALSGYEAAPDYSSTAARKRMLWLEFDSPPLDPQDRYFARVLACAPDPVLMRPDEVIPEPAEPPLPIDPELIRVVVPNQSADEAGLDAMQQLVPSPNRPHRSAKQLLVPLPEGLGPNSPEVFGFFVYEFRVGHDDSRWSTSQGRFGPPLRVTGVQHPPPALFCHAGRTPTEIRVDAAYATPVFEGRNLRPIVPNTEIWILLYVQVVQIDGASHRNVLLSRAKVKPLSRPRGDQLYGDDALLMGGTVFEQRSIVERLLSLGLPRNSPLSVLAVELLPEPEVERFADPLGGDLGHVRILRSSPLHAVPPIC